ncbi:MAG TPA: multidrug ABC transporter, partial [Elusimicrobia bacterium]|nr:multidrug ABC transporter [Elusimicrobiota bacterium]
PISILFALSFMYFADISINTMSLGGLALGVGMVIDNSNIVLESIMAYLKQHPDMPKKELIKEAAKREVGAVVGGTFTTVAIFLPFIFVSGVAGQLFKQMALTITFSMIASAMVALFLVPRLALFMRFEKYKKMDFSMRILDYIPPKLEKFLSLPRKVTWRYLFIYLFVGLVMLYFIPKEFMPKLDERRFTLNLTLPP